MGRKKKQDDIDLSKLSYKEKIQTMRNGRIDKEYLTELALNYKFKKKIDKDYPMPRELADLLLIVVDKTLGSSSWRGYTEDWKEEFRGRALEHLLRYSHNFDLEKCKNDPYNYFARLTSTAFIQSLAKCKLYAERNVLLNEDVLYSANANYEDVYEANPEGGVVNPNIDAIDYGHF
jgi:hypothetical protein